jgi:hypothetical protein
MGDRWSGVGLVLVAILLSACGAHGASHAPVPTCHARTAGDSLAAARRVAVAYVDDVVAHRYNAAAQATEPCNLVDYGSLRRLWKFMLDMPAGRSHVAVSVTRASAWPGSADARVTVDVRFGRAPYTSWITAASRTLRMDSRPGGWRVTTDVTRTQSGKLSAYGFQSYSRPRYLSGRRATVVFSTKSDEGEARAILHVADGVVSTLWRQYGGGRAARRPILFLVTDAKQAEKLAHIQLGLTRTPAGFQYSSYAYIDMPEWEKVPPSYERSMIVHELTHVASRAWVADAPHSLAEGVAMYEENLWRMQHHLGRLELVDLAGYYRHGFPSLQIWQRRVTDWGLRNPYAVDACYMDAMVMVQQIVAHHGGIGALRRLGEAFAAEAGTRRGFTPAEVDAAFRTALGVSFEHVAAEARAAAGT